MGLDMYLSKRTYVKRWPHDTPDETFCVLISRGGQPFTKIKPERVSYVIEEVGVWRKANAIHRWFVENVQGGKDECQTTYVDRSQLRNLLDLCNEVLANHDRAPHLLPTQPGFFFGTIEYDDWYFQTIEDTRRILTAALAEPATGDFEYSASW